MSATYQQGLLTLQRKRTGGNQQVTVKHIHQQVNVTQGGQAVVAGDKVMSRTRGRRRSDGGGMVKNERFGYLLTIPEFRDILNRRRAWALKAERPARVNPEKGQL